MQRYLLPFQIKANISKQRSIVVTFLLKKGTSREIHFYFSFESTFKKTEQTSNCAIFSYKKISCFCNRRRFLLTSNGDISSRNLLNSLSRTFSECKMSVIALTRSFNVCSAMEFLKIFYKYRYVLLNFHFDDETYFFNNCWSLPSFLVSSFRYRPM